MTPDRIALIRCSYARLALHATAFGLAFYDTLFRLDPGSRALFRQDMETQASKLMSMLSSIIEALDTPERVSAMFREMGERHAGYGVTERHYDTVGEALLMSLKAALGDDFNKETEAAWATLYGEIAQAMMAAARAADPTS